MWGGGGICPPTSARLLPSILLTTISAKGSTRLTPGLLPQPCPLSLGWLPASAAAPPPPPPALLQILQIWLSAAAPTCRESGQGRRDQSAIGVPFTCQRFLSTAGLSPGPALSAGDPPSPTSPPPWKHPSPCSSAEVGARKGAVGGVSISGVHNWANGVNVNLCVGDGGGEGHLCAHPSAPFGPDNTPNVGWEGGS